MKQKLDTNNPLASAPVGVTITPHSFKFSEPGDTLRGYFLGIAPFPKWDTDAQAMVSVDTAYFFDGQSDINFNCGVAIIRQLRDYNIEKGQAVEITFFNEKPNKRKGKGATKEYDLRLLKLPVFDLVSEFGTTNVCGLLPAPDPLELLTDEEATKNAERDEIMADIHAKARERMNAKSTGDPLGDLGFDPGPVAPARVTADMDIPF